MTKLSFQEATDLVAEHGKAIPVKDCETFAKIEAMGDCEGSWMNGFLWTWNGKLWYLSHLLLDPRELRELNEFHKAVETI